MSESWDGLLPVDVIMPPIERLSLGAIDALAESIRRHGLLQRVIVRPLGDEPRFLNGRWIRVRGWQLVSGHRRLEAAKLAGVTEIPVTIRLVDDAEAVEIRRAENSVGRRI